MVRTRAAKEDRKQGMLASKKVRGPCRVMNNITGLTQHFYGSASKGLLAKRCAIACFRKPVYWNKKRRMIKKLKKMMMVENLLASPPKPIMEVPGIRFSLINFKLKREGDEAHGIQPLRKKFKVRNPHLPGKSFAL